MVPRKVVVKLCYCIACIDLQLEVSGIMFSHIHKVALASIYFLNITLSPPIGSNNDWERWLIPRYNQMIGLRQEVQVFRYLGKCPHGHDYDRMNYFPEILLMIYLTYLDQENREYMSCKKQLKVSHSDFSHTTVIFSAKWMLWYVHGGAIST